MMRMLSMMLMSLMLVAADARADFAESGAQLEFYASQLTWRVRIPKQDWTVLQEKRKPDGAGFYYFVGSKDQELQFSIYLDKTVSCTSGGACRALFWGNPGPMFKDPKNVRQYERNGFHVVEFYLDGVAGIPVKQANISAHMYKDGYWIDIRVTKVSREVPDFAPLSAFLNSISVK